MGDTREAVIDTNLLVRYLVDDDPVKTKAVEALLQEAARGQWRLRIPGVVMAELVWVLESYYRMDRQEIAELVESILNTPGVDVSDAEVISQAARSYGSGSMDFIDAVILAFAQATGIRTVFTYDRRHFKGSPEIDIRQPDRRTP